eukprot:5001-Heterococcus_DN1.PRE.3
MSSQLISIDIQGFCHVQQNNTQQSSTVQHSVPDEAAALRLHELHTDSRLLVRRRVSRRVRCEELLAKSGKQSKTKRSALWQCSRCTCLNAEEQLQCGVCEAVNEGLQRRLKLQKLESAELEGLLAWRHERAQLIREDALKDVMSDFLSDSDDDVADNATDEMQTIEEHSTAQANTATTAAAPQQSAETSENVLRSQKNFTTPLPADLLRQCFAPLQCSALLVRLRVVCKAWHAVADDARLWQPVHASLCDKGLIRSAVTTGPLKTYNLVYSNGTAASGSATAASTTADSSYAVSTPSYDVHSTSTDATPGSSTAAAVAAVPAAAAAPQYHSICPACLLTQRASHTGSTCEMCNAALTPVLRHSSTTTATTAGSTGIASPSLQHQQQQQQQQQQQRFAYTRVQLHTPQSRNSGPVTATPITAGSVQAQLSSACRSTAGDSSANSRRHSNAYTPTADSLTVAANDATTGDTDANIDWYRVVKEAVVAQRVANKWDTLRTGWQWLRTNLRASLRATAAAAAATASTSSSSSVCFAVHDGDASLNRVVNKLTARGWVLLYESLKSEFSLGAEGLAREATAVFVAQQQLQQQQQQHSSADSNSTASTDVTVLEPRAKRSRTDSSIANSSSSSSSSNAVSTWESLSDVQVVKAVLWAWSAFRDWCEHIDERQ